MSAFHTSPEQILQINQDGLFDDGLFFSYNTPYTMGKVAAIYELDVEKLNIANVWDLDEAEKTISEFSRIFDINEDTATDILIEKDQISNYTGDCEDEWTTQKFQLRAAKELSYDAIEVNDEQGAALLVAMSGKLELLKLCVTK